jgi:hypothetical protein
MVTDTVPTPFDGHTPCEEQVTLKTFIINGIIQQKDIGFVSKLANQQYKLTEAQLWWARTHINRYVPGTYTLGPRPMSLKQKREAKVPATDDELMELLEEGLAVIRSQSGDIAATMDVVEKWSGFP